MRPVLQAFADGATSVRDCLPPIRSAFAISEDAAQDRLPSGTTTVLSSRVHWARTCLAKAGLLTSPRRGVHQITPRGREVLGLGDVRLDNAFLRARFAEFDDWVTSARLRPRGGGDSDDPETAAPQGAVHASAPRDDTPALTPIEMIERAFAEIEAALAGELLQHIQRMDALDFERLVLDLLTAMGYGSGIGAQRTLTRASGDGGIDGIIYEDALGLDAVYIQAKRYSPDNKISRPAIQQFVGSLTGEGATKGVFVTTSGFSREAQDYLRRVQHRIVLIDGTNLARMLMAHGVGVRTRQTFVVREIDLGQFGDDG